MLCVCSQPYEQLRLPVTIISARKSNGRKPNQSEAASSAPRFAPASRSTPSTGLEVYPTISSPQSGTRPAPSAAKPKPAYSKPPHLHQSPDVHFPAAFIKYSWYHARNETERTKPCPK